MVRKKWKNQTPEEREQRRLNTIRNKAKGKTFRQTDDMAAEIYAKGGVPIRCFKHGWFKPKNYRVRISNTMGQKFVALTGNCPECDNECDKAFPDPLSNEGLIFAAVLGRLAREGKLIDERPANWQSYM